MSSELGRKLWIAVLGIALAAAAQGCKEAGTPQGCTVQVPVCAPDGSCRTIQPTPCESFPESIAAQQIFEFDAKTNAAQGLGCPSNLLSWPASLGGLTATLRGFGATNCAEAGWVGAGDSENPYALVLDGANTFVTIPDSAAMHVRNVTVELLAGFSPDSLPVDGSVLFSKEMSDGNGGVTNPWFSVVVANGEHLSFRVGTELDDCVSKTSVTSFSEGAFFDFTYDGSVAQIWIDGLLDQTCALGRQVTGSSGQLVLGARDVQGQAPSAFSSVALVEVSLFNQAVDHAFIRSRCVSVLTSLVGVTDPAKISELCQ